MQTAHLQGATGAARAPGWGGVLLIYTYPVERCEADWADLEIGELCTAAVQFDLGGLVADHSLFQVYISVILVTAAMGYALTACHLEKPQVTKGFCPFRSVPRLGSACPRSGPAPWARRHRPSMAGGG